MQRLSVQSQTAMSSTLNCKHGYPRQTRPLKSWPRSTRSYRRCCLDWQRCCRLIRFRRCTLSFTIQKSECFAKISHASTYFFRDIIFSIAKPSCDFSIPKRTEKRSCYRPIWMWTQTAPTRIGCPLALAHRQILSRPQVIVGQRRRPPLIHTSRPPKRH